MVPRVGRPALLLTLNEPQTVMKEIFSKVYSPQNASKFTEKGGDTVEKVMTSYMVEWSHYATKSNNWSFVFKNYFWW